METKPIKWNAVHCWRSRDELISDVLLWTPTYGRAKAGRPARTYIQQLCEDTGCSPEDLPEAMNDREKWRERVRDIRATSTTWWWWWWWCISTPKENDLKRHYEPNHRSYDEYEGQMCISRLKEWKLTWYRNRFVLQKRNKKKNRKGLSFPLPQTMYSTEWSLLARNLL